MSKLLCVERDRGGLLVVGKIYTYVGSHTCDCEKKLTFVAEEPLSPRALRWAFSGRCIVCSGKRPRIPYKIFRSSRFIPWNPDALGITIEEVNQLYQPGPRVPIKEKA